MVEGWLRVGITPCVRYFGSLCLQQSRQPQNGVKIVTCVYSGRLLEASLHWTIRVLHTALCGFKQWASSNSISTGAHELPF